MFYLSPYDGESDFWSLRASREEVTRLYESIPYIDNAKAWELGIIKAPYYTDSYTIDGKLFPDESLKHWITNDEGIEIKSPWLH